MRNVVVGVSVAVGLLATVAAPASGSSANASITVSDEAARAGIARVTNDEFDTPVVVDLDGDGHSDLVLGNHNLAGAEVFRGQPDGTFTRTQTLTVSDRHGCTAGDFDGDGRPDLFCVVGADRGTSSAKSDELWLQQRDGTLDLVTSVRNAIDPSGRGRSAATIDVNHDGIDDLFVGNGFPILFPSYNQLYVSDAASLADGSAMWFRPTVALGPKQRAGGTCSAVADYDRDGWQDLFVCGVPDQLYRSDRGHRLTDVARTVPGLGSTRSQGAVWGDLDGDGNPDLVTVSSTRLSVHLFDGARFRTAFTEPLVAGEAVALADVDRDGHLDVYVVQGRTSNRSRTNEPDLLLLNEGSGSRYRDVSSLLPQATTGSGNAVSVIPDLNGYPALVVTNGGYPAARFEGPRQLLVVHGPDERSAP